MKAFLMYRDRDFDPRQELPVNEPALTQDLELNTLFDAIALGDNFLFEAAKTAVLSGLSSLRLSAIARIFSRIVLRMQKLSGKSIKFQSGQFKTNRDIGWVFSADIRAAS